MNEEALNQSLRRFLKTFGVTAQRAIEEAVRQGAADGRLGGRRALRATATIRIAELGLDQRIEGDIEVD